VIRRCQMSRVCVKSGSRPREMFPPISSIDFVQVQLLNETREVAATGRDHPDARRGSYRGIELVRDRNRVT
jgi:hypothetical protein